jgi:cellulose biosynthesis protein BcsQ
MDDLYIRLIEIFQTIFEFSTTLPTGNNIPDNNGSIFWLEVSTKLVLLIAALFSAFFWGRRVLKAKLQQILIDPDAFWNKKTTSNQLSAYKKQINKSIPVIAIANYKGGVGKSMISANLAAYFDKAGARVLLIDYDYQGSLTDIVPYANKDSMTFSAQYILEGKNGFHKPEKLGRSFKRTDIYPAETGLSRVDSKIVFDWLIGATKKDIRFNTYEYISQPKIQNNYDLVIIDTPPRLSAATANALCAATHILVPTILDTVSSRTVIRTLDMFVKFRNSLGLNFSFLGVVPSQKQNNVEYTNREKAALKYLKNELNSNFGNLVNPITKQQEKIEVLEHQPIMHKVGLLHLDGDDLSFFKKSPRPGEAIIVQMFTRLGNVIVHKIVKHPGCHFKIAAKDIPHESQRTAGRTEQPEEHLKKLAG